MRLLGLGLTCLMLTLLCSPAFAQSDAKTAQAAIVFDMRMEKVMTSPLGKALELKDKLNELPVGDGPNPAKLVRVFGASTAPENMEDLESMQMGELPVEFFVRLEFSDAASAKAVLSKGIEDNAGTVERNGKTYYKAPSDSGLPEGIMMYSPDEKSIEIGSEGFVFRSNAKPFTNELNNAWSKVPDHAVRLAFDLDTAKGLVAELVKNGQESVGQPMVAEMLNVFNEMKSMSMSFDLSSNHLMTMTAKGKSQEAAEAVKEAMDGAFFMAKQAGKMQAKILEESDPDQAKVVNGILDGMKVEINGDIVSVTIPRPEGFEDMAKTAVGGILNQMIPAPSDDF